jgi:hypothetical protein
MSDGPLIHIGYPKTASSWLQAHLFCEESAVGLAAVATAAHINREIVGPNALDFDPASTRRHFERRIRKVEEAGATAVRERRRSYRRSGSRALRTPAATIRASSQSA